MLFTSQLWSSSARKGKACNWPATMSGYLQRRAFSGLPSGARTSELLAPPLIAANVNIGVGRSQCCNGCSQMSSVSGFDNHLELHRLGRQIGEDALMQHLDDVGA